MAPSVLVAPGPRIDPGLRGSLTIAERVVARIASAAATEVHYVHGTRRVLPVRSRSVLPSRRPQAGAHIRRGTANVSLTLAVDYPVSVRTTAEAVRARVREQVAALTGLRVVRVDVDVTTLTSASAGRGEPRVR